MNNNGILYLSNEDVKKVLDLGRAIEITEQALRDHSEGRVIWSTPEDLAIKPEQGWQSWVTGCALATEPVAGFPHPIHQSRGRQPRCIASAARAKTHSDSQ
jgi:ornithine cyclodeaminase/alanine dehydrogenase-like protein (mu-crystallin family)